MGNKTAEAKSAIITCTSGDFEYIDEWIEHHHKLGVDLFLVGYNGPSDRLKEYKQYDYVRYVDFSYNQENMSAFKDAKFSSWKGTDVYKQDRMQKIENVLLYYLKVLYQDIKYCIVIDTDEFIDIKDSQFTNVNDYLAARMPDINSSISIWMNFYTDNDHIYKSDEPCMRRFTEMSEPRLMKYNQGSKKIIINMYHPDTKDIVLTSPHTCARYMEHFDLPENEIAIRHFWTKSLEEWIEKMNPDVDPDYFNRFRGQIFTRFFEGAGHNRMSEEKIKAIPALLGKYGINYDIDEEQSDAFKEMYHKING